MLSLLLVHCISELDDALLFALAVPLSFYCDLFSSGLIKDGGSPHVIIAVADGKVRFSHDQSSLVTDDKQ